MPPATAGRSWPASEPWPAVHTALTEATDGDHLRGLDSPPMRTLLTRDVVVWGATAALVAVCLAVWVAVLV